MTRMHAMKDREAQRVARWIPCVLAIAVLACRCAVAEEPPARNVIVLVVDGCASEQYTLARWYKGEPLALDAIRVGAVKTNPSDSVIPDSASVASAYATGYRTGERILSLGPRKRTVSKAFTPPPGQRLAPRATVLEGARLLGKATGIVATSRVTHATPAAYMSHVALRSRENDIMEQAVYQNVDIVLGGGRQHLVPLAAGGQRDDNEDLRRVLRQRGYQMPRNRADLMAIGSGKVFGLFAESHLAAEIDREELGPLEPSLLEMTQKAIELLSADPEGFFLLVEASQVDWACHANDPAHLIGDLLMYDRVVEHVLDFAKRDGRTLVLALSDHNTGGMTLGNRATDGSYGRTSLGALVDPLRGMKRTAGTVWKEIAKDPNTRQVMDVVREYWGLDITPEEARRILNLAAKHGKNREYNALGEILCPAYTVLGWTTHGHTGGDVPLHAYGPNRPVGLFDGPEIGRITAAALGLDLDALNGRLFQDVSEALPGAGVTIHESGSADLVVHLSLGDRTAELWANKNFLKLGGQFFPLEGVVVCVGDKKGRKVYIPMEAVQRISGVTEPLPPVKR